VHFDALHYIPTQCSNCDSPVLCFMSLTWWSFWRGERLMTFSQRHYTHCHCTSHSPHRTFEIVRRFIFDTATLYSITLTSHIDKHSIAIHSSRGQHTSSLSRRNSPPIPSDLISITILYQSRTARRQWAPIIRRPTGVAARRTASARHFRRSTHPPTRQPHSLC